MNDIQLTLYQLLAVYVIGFIITYTIQILWDRYEDQASELIGSGAALFNSLVWPGCLALALFIVSIAILMFLFTVLYYLTFERLYKLLTGIKK